MVINMNEVPAHILVVDDEADIRGLLRILLEKEGYRVSEAADGAAAVKFVKAHPAEVSLIILDIMMPAVDGGPADGIAASLLLREMTDAPILFLTARSSDADKTAAYAGGGDDYMVKPFHAIDLKLKIGALLKRYQLYHGASTAETPADGWVQLPGDVEWRPDEQAVFRLGERVMLTDREYALFVRLVKGRGTNLPPSVLYEDVWGETYLASSSNTVIVHIANLRRKLEKDPSSPVLIRTVWGKGYRID